MDIKIYLLLKEQILDSEYKYEYNYINNIKPCSNDYNFYMQCTYVIINSGMKNQIAEKIYDKIIEAIYNEIDINTIFKHKGKCKAIKYIYDNREKLFSNFLNWENKIEYLQTIPFIGKITCYHLARNLGIDTVKPDRHLIRISKLYNTTPGDLCAEIQKITGEKLGTIDYVIWRSANLKRI